MSGMQVNSTVTASASWQSQSAAQAAEKKDSGPDLYEMMRDAKEKADATREKFNAIKPKPRYGDAPMEAYARLARAKRPSEVNAAAGFARRQIARLKAAKQADPDNAKRIQASINQLQKAVQRAGKKNRMQNHIAAVDMELREQAQKLASSIQPSMEAVAQQYAADSAAMALPEEVGAPASGGEIDLQA